MSDDGPQQACACRELCHDAVIEELTQLLDEGAANAAYAAVEEGLSLPRRSSGSGDRLGQMPSAPDKRSTPGRNALDLDLQGEAQNGPDQHDQPEDGHVLHGRLDRDRAYQVGSHQDLEAEQQHAPERLPEGLIGDTALPDSPPDPHGKRDGEEQAQDEDG